MPFQLSRFLIAISLTSSLAVPASRAFGQPAQAPTSQEPQKNFKDRAEYDLYEAIRQDTNPATRLEKLLQWEKQYPSTDYSKERRAAFLSTYGPLGKAKEAVEAARQVLADNPKDFTGLYYTMYFTQALFAANPQETSILDNGAKSATAILANIDNPPAGATTEAWSKLRPEVELSAHVTLGFVAMQKKSWDAAETEFQKSLQMSPNNAQVDYWLGTVIASQANPDKQSIALFYFARAAAYDGTGSLEANFRKNTVLPYVDRQYKRYHGDGDGFNELIALAKNQAAPPANYHIKTAQEIAEGKANEQERWNKEHPQEAMWRGIKAALTGSDGANYFNSGMKDAELPVLKGKVVRLEPALKPKTVVLAIEDGANNGSTPDATLKFETPLPGKVEVGTELSFKGIPESYTTSPFMVVFNVDKEKLEGWTGKNPSPAHKPASKGKASAKK